MPALSGSAQPVALGQGYAIRAPGLRGNATLRTPPDAQTRSRSRAADDGTAALDAAFAATELTEVRRIDLTLQAPPAAAAAPMRSGDGTQQLLELQVPDLGPATGQVVLAVDETGVLTWHLPVDDAQAVQPPTTRGSGGVKRFLIPAHRPQPAPDAAGGQRSLIGALGRKLLKVLVYPITDPIIGAISEAFAARWEARKRPYGLRDFAPASFRDAEAAALTAADISRLAQGRALLFVHGTFSTAHGAFCQIPDDVMTTLHQRYGGRVFAFNHPSLSQDPLSNARWLLDELQRLQVGSPPLEVDIVCHSRGGLVARSLAHASDGKLAVRRIVFVGVPNAGTLLAHPDHMVKMLDRLTTALNLFPTGPVTETLEAIITVVKVIGHGALGGLDGLASMHPAGPFLAALNGAPGGGDGYFAISADYEPQDAGLKGLVTGGAADAVIDRVFEGALNDLVVPEVGVYAVEGSAAFPVPPARRLQISADQGVLHTTLFGYAAASARLLDWLPG